MDWTPAESSLISAYKHEGTTLYLKFKSNGAAYSYPAVDDAMYADMKAAPSIGKWFMQNIKTNEKHPATRLFDQ